ncbi:hypothetical protein BGW39_004278, partial [Mortierella sp. 14UC]
YVLQHNVGLGGAVIVSLYKKADLGSSPKDVAPSDPIPFSRNSMVISITLSSWPPDPRGDQPRPWSRLVDHRKVVIGGP